MEEGSLLPGMGTSDKPRKVQRPAWWRGRHRCCSCPLHCLPGPYTTSTHTAQAPQSFIYRLDLAARSEIPPAQHFCRKGVVLLMRHSFHRGGHLACSPPPEPSHTDAPLFLWGSPRALPSQQTLKHLCSERQCPDSISWRKIWNPRPRV